MITIDDKLVKWICGYDYWIKLKKNKKNNQIEFEFISQYYILTSRSMWSSGFGETLVKSILRQNNIEILPINKIGNIIPDIETSKAIIEVKTRNYTTSGTCGEKILGAPYKYCGIYDTTKKPIYIVLVGYQEYEARTRFNMSKNTTTAAKKKLLDIYWREFKIRYIFLSELYFNTKNILTKI
jgi:hypothetical protein